MAQPLPKRHSRNLMFHQNARKFALDLPCLHLIVEFRNFGQRVGGDQPDLPGARIGYSHQIQIGLDIAGRHGPQLLTAERNAFLRSSFRLVKASHPSAEGRGTVHHRLELGCDAALRRFAGAPRSSAGTARRCCSRRTGLLAESRGRNRKGWCDPADRRECWRSAACRGDPGAEPGSVADCARSGQESEQQHRTEDESAFRQEVIIVLPLDGRAMRSGRCGIDASEKSLYRTALSAMSGGRCGSSRHPRFGR